MNTIKKLVHPVTNSPFIFVNKSQFAIQQHYVFANKVFHSLNVFGKISSSYQLDPKKAPYVVIQNPEVFLKTLPQDFIDLHQLYI
jgi:hypothetical protein